MASDTEAKKTRETKKSMTAQARLIVMGLAISTAFIFASAWFATCSIDKNMTSAYKNFGQVFSKDLTITKSDTYHYVILLQQCVRMIGLL